MPNKIFLISIFVLIPCLAIAHGVHGSGMIAGFTHPILGIDHNVAILGTGFLGYLLQPKRWYLPSLAFILLMAIGGLMGIDNEATLLIEKSIAFSVLIVGIMILFRDKVNYALILLLLAAFGFIHGYAHGAEMPQTNTVIKYIPGYLIGTTLLASIGSLIARIVSNRKSNITSVSIVGGIIIGCGLMIILN